MTQITRPDRAMSRSEQLRNVPEGGRETSARSTERRRTDEEQRSDRLSPETNPERRPVRSKVTVGGRWREDGLTPEGDPGKEDATHERLHREEKADSDHGILGKETKVDKYTTADTGKYLDTDAAAGTQTDKLEQHVLEEERVSQLVAGIHLHGAPTGEALKNEKVEGKHTENQGNERADNQDVSPSPSFSRTSVQNPPTLVLSITPTKVPPVSSHLPTRHSDPRFFHHVVTAAPALSLIDDLLIEVLESHRLNELQPNAVPNLKDAKIISMLRNPARKNLQNAHRAEDKRKVITVIQPKESDASALQVETPKPKESSPALKTNENLVTAKPTMLAHKPKAAKPTGKAAAAQLMSNGLERTVKPNKASPVLPQLAKLELTTARTPSARPENASRAHKKTFKKSVEKAAKKNNKNHKPSDGMEEVTTPAYFPYFMDNYCPPDCVCYGR